MVVGIMVRLRLWIRHQFAQLTTPNWKRDVLLLTHIAVKRLILGAKTNLFNLAMGSAMWTHHETSLPCHRLFDYVFIILPQNGSRIAHSHKALQNHSKR